MESTIHVLSRAHHFGRLDECLGRVDCFIADSNIKVPEKELQAIQAAPLTL